MYRHHRVHQCQRCKDVFNSQDDLDTHVEAIQACEVKPDQAVDGITNKIKERLQSRKKAYPGQTEANRWGEVYQVLFPNEEVPSPCNRHPLLRSKSPQTNGTPDFEPIQDYYGNDTQLPDSREVANYEDFLRRELPNFFKTALESAVNHEIQPIEERMRRQMLSILEEAQKQAFLKYRSIASSVEQESRLLTTMPEHSSSLDEEPTTSNKTDNNSIIDITSNSKSQLELATDTDGSVPLLNSETLGVTCSDETHTLPLFSDEWALDSDQLDPNIFNWTPSLDIPSHLNNGHLFHDSVGDG